MEDDKESPRFIQTVPGEGYRFIAEVVEKTPQAVSESRENDATPDLSKKEGGGAGSAAKRAQRSIRWIGLATLLVLAIGSVWFYLARLARRSSQLPPMKVVCLTSFPGKEIEPALSPDGKMVAIVWDGEKGDNRDVYVMLMDAGKPLRLTTDPGDEYSPTWSPDGRFIAFRRNSKERSGIYLVASLGGAERTLAAEDHFFSTLSRPRRSLSNARRWWQRNALG